MPSTAILMSANGDSAIHAYRPDEPRTLCGLEVVWPEDRDPDDIPPYRSADVTGRRFYIGLNRLMCGRCTKAAEKVRTEAIKTQKPAGVHLRIVS